MEIKGFIHRIDEIENHGFNFTSRFFYLRFQDRTGKTQYGKFKLSNGKIDLLEGFAINDEVNVICADNAKNKTTLEDIEIGSIRQDKVYNKSTYFHNTLNKHLNPSLAKTFQGSLSSRLIKEFNSCKIEDILDELYNYIKENYIF